jgi:acyl-CoA synthetase (AMP-forming)/AMP-acid ligase II
MSFHASQLGSIVEGERRVPGAGLAAAIAERKEELAALGCGEGSCAALVQPNEAAFFVNLLALWELGACAVPLPPSATPAELGHALAHSGCGFVFRGGRFERREPSGEAPPAGTALLLYTSGSSGAPKGVMLSYAAVRSKLETLSAEIPGDALARTLCLLPVSFGHGLLGNSLPALLGGHELHLEPAFSPALTAALGEFLDVRKITFLSSVPAVWKAVLPFAAPPRAGTLRAAFCASADLSVNAWREARQWLGDGVDFRNVYGLTEAASWVSALPAGEPYEAAGAVGRGWGCELKLADGTNEILIAAPYLMTGYHRDPAGTAEVFQGGFFRTGDLGELDPAKGLRVLGRLKDLINRGGLKVSPLEVEARLREHPAVRDCCVFAFADPVAGEGVGAAVVLSGGAPDARELRAFCRAALSEFKVPERIFFLAELPRGARGKTSRRAVAAACGETAP